MYQFIGVDVSEVVIVSDGGDVWRHRLIMCRTSLTTNPMGNDNIKRGILSIVNIFPKFLPMNTNNIINIKIVPSNKPN